MPRDFFPRGDADAVAFTANFSHRINADAALYHVSPERAAAYAQLQLAYAQAYQATANAGTATRSGRVVRREARAALERETRSIAAIIRVVSDIPLADKIAVGVKVRSNPSRIARPSVAPAIVVRSVVGRTVTVDLLDAESHKRRMPRGVRSAVVHTGVGGQPLAGDFTFGSTRLTSTTRVRIQFTADLPPGTRVWLSACWMNPRHQRGPGCEPVFTHLGYALAPTRTLASAA
jgi:hypothetical protein